MAELITGASGGVLGDGLGVVDRGQALKPDDSEPRDILDIIDEAVAGITDAEIEERLRETLDRANRPGVDRDGNPGGDS